MANPIDTVQLADILSQSLQHLLGPLKDMVKELMGLEKEEEVLVEKTKKLRGFWKSLGDGFPELTERVKGLSSTTKEWLARMGERTMGGNIVSALSTVAGAGAKVFDVPAMLKGLTGGLTSAFTGIAGSLQSIFGPIASLVGKMNPALVEMFTLAMDDLQAVMGSILEPILKAAIPLIQKIASILLTIKPAFDPIIDVIVELIGMIADMLVPIFKVITPLIQLFGAILKMMMPIVHSLEKALLQLLKMFELMVKSLINSWNELAKTDVGKAMGMQTIKLIGLDDRKSAVGAAIRQTGFASAEELGRQSRAKALMGTTISPEEKAAEGIKLEVNKASKEIGGKMDLILTVLAPGMAVMKHIGKKTDQSTIKTIGKMAMGPIGFFL